MSKGIATEVLFDYTAMNKGLTISRPITDVSYDRIVEHNGKLTRVQIKMTGYLRSGRSYEVHSSRGSKIPYKDTIDVLAIYIEPEDAWVVLPASEVKGVKMKITMAGVYSKYVNNWDIFYAQKN